MDWREEYKRKLVSAEEAVKVVKSGDRVNFGFPRQATLLTMWLLNMVWLDYWGSQSGNELKS